MRKRACFKIADLTETKSRLQNPNRGFYQLFHIRLGDKVDYADYERCLVEEETLILLVVALDAYRDKPLDAEALAMLREAVAFFVSHGKQLIVRGTYDTMGKAKETEPKAFELVRQHFKQLLKALASMPQDIFVYQGLLIGNWGEMHGSDYMTRYHLAELCAIADDYLPKNTFLAVRKPMQYRQLRADYGNHKTNGECQIGLFNDAILASESDLGTYGNGEDERYTYAWSRKKELGFISRLCEETPLGGETVLGDGYVKAMQTDEIIACLKMMHVTYLNRLYDMQMLDYFRSIRIKKGTFKDKSLYDYIEAHLGYRYLVKHAGVSFVKEEATKECMECTVEIANTGFARAYFDIELFLVVQGQTETVVSLGYVHSVAPGESTCYRTRLDGHPIKDKQKLSFSVYMIDKQNERIVSFANKMTDNRVLLGTLLP